MSNKYTIIFPKFTKSIITFDDNVRGRIAGGAFRGVSSLIVVICNVILHKSKHFFVEIRFLHTYLPVQISVSNIHASNPIQNYAY